MKLVLTFFGFIIITNFLSAQSNPIIMDSLLFVDPIESRTIYFGIDPSASDTLDFSLGEANLPPFPPAPTLEVRFNMPLNSFSGEKSSYRDFRNGTIPFTGQKEHRIQFQSHGSLKMYCTLPPQITIHVEDLFGGVLVNKDLTGDDSLSILDALNQLKLIINYTNATDVDDESTNPSNFSLSQNFPNPFNPSTTINFSLIETQYVSLKVFDILGREVATLINGEVSSGNHSVDFSAAGFTSGIYFYQLKAGDQSLTKSMILMK